MNKNIKEIKQKVAPILEEYGATKAGIFGSAVRGEMSKTSDVDMLVELPDDVSLLDFVGLRLKLEEALGEKVDLGEYSTIKPQIKDRILAEHVQILKEMK